MAVKMMRGKNCAQNKASQFNQGHTKLGKVVYLGRDWAEKRESKGGEKKGQERGKVITGCADLCLMLPGGTSQAVMCCSLQQEQDKKPDLLSDHQCQVCVRGQQDQRGVKWVLSLASEGTLDWGDRAPWHHHIHACSRPDGISLTATL